MKQNNQSSWATRLRKLSALCLMLVASANIWATDKLTIKPDIKAGADKGTITISLDNETSYTAFQMEITLPAGLTIEKQTDDYSAMSIVTERNNAHQVLYNQLESGVIKVAAFSFDGTNGNEPFTGNSGDLLVIEVNVASDYTPADVDIQDIKFVRLSKVASENLTAVTDFDVVNEQGEEVLLGDVDGNSKVDTNDAILVIKYFLGIDLEGANFNAAVADVTGDNTIDTNDAVAIIQIFLNN
jgi:hypothetical protein